MFANKKILLFIFFTITFLTSQAQKTDTVIKNLIDNRFVPITSIDPKHSNFSDLLPFKEAIGNARIVMLGEQDHGDAATFLAKTRLIKFLHEQCGFDVLAFESDFYSLNMSWERALNKEIDIKTVCHKKNVYPIWTRCEQNQELFKYLDDCLNNGNPLMITGIDCRHAGGYSKDNFVRQLDSTMKALKVPFIKSSHYAGFITTLSEVMAKEYASKVSSDQQNEFLQFVDTLSLQMKDLHVNGTDFWHQELINLKAYAENSWLPVRLINPYSSNIRDVQMSSNLIWLAKNKYADKKIIVWAHNYHIAKNFNTTEARKSSSITTMGNEVYKEFKDKVYALGFDSYQGTSGQLGAKKYKVKKSTSKSIEYQISKKNRDFGFINFKGWNNASSDSKTKFKMKALFHEELTGPWLTVFDGIFYIKDMYPCKECN